MERILQLATFKHSTVKRGIGKDRHMVVVIERNTGKILLYREFVTEVSAKTAYDIEVVKAKSRG
jgi:hypothetical protein